MQEIARRTDGVRTLEMPTSGRAEIGLAAPVTAGYLVTNGELRDLPYVAFERRKTSWTVALTSGLGAASRCRPTGLASGLAARATLDEWQGWNAAGCAASG